MPGTIAVEYLSRSIRIIYAYRRRPGIGCRMFPDSFACVFVNAGKDTLCLPSGSGYRYVNVIRQFFLTHCDGRLYTAGNTVLGGTFVRLLPDDLTSLGVNFPYRNLCSGITSPSQTEGGTDVQVKMPILYREHRRGVGIVQNVLCPYKLQGIQIQTHQIAAVI